VAAAQAFRVGDTFNLGGTTAPVEQPDVAYDSNNNRYLQVAGKVFIEAHLLNAAGSIIRTFNVTNSGLYAQNPRVAFSPDIAGGGGYLVTWHASIGDIARVRGRIFNANGDAVTGEFDIATNASTVLLSSQWTMGAPAAYSTGSDEFLVVWGGAKYTTFDIFGVRVSNNGTLLGTPFLISGGGADLYDRDPSVAYSPVTNKFLVGWGIYHEAGKFGYSAARTVTAGSGALGPQSDIGSAVGVFITSMAYDSTNDQFLFAWNNMTASNPRPHYGQLFNSNGSPIGGIKVVSGYYGSYDALDVEFNSYAGEYFLITHGLNHEDAGVTVKADGNAFDNGFLATSTSGVNGNFHPRLATSTAEKKWLVVTATQFARASGQFVSSNSTGSGPSTPPPPPPPPSPSPTPTPAPTDSTAARERARSDFNGDGSYDILWQDISGGYLAAWTLSGNSLLSSDLLSHRNGDNNWRIVGTGDFNRDGKPDIVWHHRTQGWVGVWYMNGHTLIDSVYFSVNRVFDTNWKIVGVGDFNSDGKADLVWQHDTDRWLAVWLLDGVTVTDSVLMNPNKVYDARWQIAGVGDFSRDGKPDLVWRHSTTGEIGLWLMDGLNLIDSIPVYPGVLADLNWKIAGVMDANSDGKPDLVWHHITEGWVGVWYMNGNDLVDSVWLGPGRVPDTAWRVMGPK
jgi:hypothetical protein